MVAPINFPAVNVQGKLTFGSIQEIPADSVAQRQLARFPIPWEAWRVWNALHTNLPGTPATDDLGLVGGTFGTESPSIQTEDLKAAGATSSYARCVRPLPAHYEAGQTVQLVFHAGMLSAIADNSATLNVEVYRSDGEAGIGSDLYSGSALTINNLTLADKTFLIDPATLNAGDLLDIRIHVAVNDAATGDPVKAIIGSAELQCDIR